MRPAGCIALLALALALVPTGAPTGAAPSPAGPGPTPAAAVRVVTLRNGLRLLLAPDPAAAAVDVAVWYRAGVASEPAGRQGISHLFGRLMLAGSAHYGPLEHDRLVEAEGGQPGAYITPDYSCYFETIPASALELAFRLEADRMASTRLTPESLAEAVRVVGADLRRQSEQPVLGGALQAFYELAWGDHPYRRLTAERGVDLSRITLQDCQEFHAARFAPNDAVVTVVGRFDPDQALKAARRWLETVPRRRTAPVPPAPKPAQKAEQRAWARLDVPIGIVIAGWKLPGRAAPETPALGLASRVLGAGATGRLQRALVTESSGFLSVQSGLDARGDGGLLYVVAAVRPGADTAAVESALIAQVESLARAPVSDEELEAARRQEATATLLAWQSPRGAADALGSGLIVDGDWRAAALRFERLQRLTAADVQRAAAATLTAARRSVLWVTPSRAGRGAPPAARAARNRPGQPSSEGDR